MTASPPAPDQPGRCSGEPTDTGGGLHVRNLYVTRGGRTLISSLGFSAPPGTMLELRGPNGCGKTTLLRVLAGLAGFDRGQMARNAAAHYCGHEDGVKPRLSVEEQLRFWAAMIAAPPGGVESALSGMGLEAWRAVPGSCLSAGQCRRLALARLCLARRPIWLLDEPFAGLDAQGRDRLQALAHTHIAEGGIILAAAHGDGFDGAAALDLTDPPPPPPPLPEHAGPEPGQAFPHGFAGLLRREIRLAHTGSSGLLVPAAFYAGCTALAPLGLGPELTERVAPGLVTTALALSSLLPLERLFRDDLEDGSLDALCGLGISTDTMALAALTGHWLGIGLPLAALAPAMWIALGGAVGAAGLVLIVAIAASLAMFSLGAVAAALTVGPRRAGPLTSILALPLYWPVVIFAASALGAAHEGGPAQDALMLTVAAALFALATAPFAISACLRAATDR